MRRTEYITRGTCSRMITVEVGDDDRIASVQFAGGCSGNTQGVASLVRGMHIDEAIERLEGIDCHGKGTSCPDQLAQALKTLG
ncbi:MAG: TIGR03905 family TSCPD domain-containing protein [Alistipes sp.]|nr:TIGR03905 family TSCPD domain-containing protein [Alistipes sp.]